jgi:4-amino-4-deoxy-L-arabinose transferase-like glycosyltransferase
MVATSNTKPTLARWLVLLVFVLALVPRITPQSVLTIDENTFWVARSQVFRQAIQQGDWADTRVAPHPGVVTMWMGTLGLTLDEAVNGPDHQQENYFGFLQTMRLPMGVLNALCVAVGFLLLRRLFALQIALLAALFWAFDPFLIAHSQILHTDAPVTSFIVLSVLSGFVAFRLDEPDQMQEPVRWRYLALSAVFGGLAALSKSTGLIAGPVLFFAVFGVNLKAFERLRWVRRLLGPLILWGVGVLLTWSIVWPAAWVNLLGTFEIVIQGFRLGVSDHSNFLFGEVIPSPGPHYYPVAVFLRMTPWLLFGLVALIFAGETRRAHRRAVAGLLIFGVVFFGLMALQSKKFDRYMLPLFPALNLLAAVGWVGVVSRWRERRPELFRLRPPVIWGAAVILLAGNVALYFPYLLSYYNPLAGGGDVAEEVIMVGWGEGLGHAADYIRADSGQACGHAVVSSWGDIITSDHLPCSTFYPVNADGVRRLDDTGYIVLYINQVQSLWDDDQQGDGSIDVPAVLALVQDVAPRHTVQIHGITYAWIYHAADLPPTISYND